jgi:hypothetical protein
MSALSRYDLALRLLYHRGKPLNLDQFPFIKTIYECRAPHMMFKTGRQVTKSTTLSNLLLVDCAVYDYFNVLFATPLQEQVSRFSRGYLDQGIKGSPDFKAAFYDRECTWNVKEKSLRNHSTVFLTYCHNGPDRARGISADMICYDEAQDIPWEYIPVINETMSASPYRWSIVAGTPKTMDGTLEFLWEDSSQHEWIVQCQSCSKWNMPAGKDIYKMIQPYGVACQFCKKVLDVSKGMWHALKPENSKRSLGFHVPQICVPRNVSYNLADPTDRPPNVPKSWQELYMKYKKYPPAMFANEVLGLSYDMGGRIVSLAELRRCCVLPPMRELNRNYPHGCTALVAGVDWGISATESFTVLTIGGQDSSGMMKMLYAKKFYSTDTVEQTREIAAICKAWGVAAIGADFGVGYTNNLLLRELLGWDRVFEYQYAHATHILKWNGDVGRYILNRTSSLNLMFFDIKSEQMQFPAVKDMDDLFKDILSLYESIIESPKQTYKVLVRTPKIPDDFAHALNFMSITAKKISGDKIVNMKVDENIFEELVRRKMVG